MVRRIATGLLAVLALTPNGPSSYGTQPTVVLEGHGYAVNSLAFSPDGRLLASAAGRFVGLLQEPRPGEAIVWLDIGHSNTRVVLDAHDDGVSCVSFAPDGSLLATGGYDCTVIFWDVTSWRKRATIVHTNGAVLSCAFSPDGALFATGGWGGNAEDSAHETNLWNVRTQALVATLSGPSSGINAISFSPDGGRIALGTMDGSAMIWNVGSGVLEKTLEVSDEPWLHSVAFSPDGRHFAAGAGPAFAKTSGKLILWQCDAWQQVANLDAHRGDVRCVAFGPHSRLLASCGEDGVIALWDTGSLRKLRSLREPDRRSILTLAFSPDGHRLASGRSDGIIDIWELEN